MIISFVSGHFVHYTVDFWGICRRCPQITLKSTPIFCNNYSNMSSDCSKALQSEQQGAPLERKIRGARTRRHTLPESLATRCQILEKLAFSTYLLPLTRPLTLPMLRLLLSKAQGCKDLWKTSKPCHVGIHWKALTEFSQMSTHMSWFQSFFIFLHHFLFNCFYGPHSQH